jgi:ABC-2 type transport system ATP-binding protein
MNDGTTVLLTTHYLEEAESLADRVAIMHEGSIVVTGRPDEVAQRVPARITFRAPDASRELLKLPEAVVRVEDGRVTIESRRLQSDLTALLSWADEHALELAGLAARPASLEDVFLDVLARSGEGTLAPREEQWR